MSSLRDFVLGRVLHRGGFSSLQIAKKKEAGEEGDKVFVLKVLDGLKQGGGRKDLLSAEIAIRSEASAWFLGLEGCWEEKEGLKTCLLMEYLPGGNFADLVQKNGGFLTESVAMFYIGELILALNAVHSVGYAHRNVQPENILLDGSGHIKLSGFSCASKIGEDGCVSSPIEVESASYEAPEILRTLGDSKFSYGIECDWWSVGVIAYEVVTGVHPFKSSSPLSAYKKITAKKVKGTIKVRARTSQACKDFILGLLLEKEERLKYEDCINHAFFNDFIWDGIRNEIPPLTPTIQEETVDACTNNNATPFSTPCRPAYRTFTKLPQVNQDSVDGEKAVLAKDIDLSKENIPQHDEPPPETETVQKRNRHSSMKHDQDEKEITSRPKQREQEREDRVNLIENILRAQEVVPVPTQLDSEDKDDLIMELTIQTHILKHQLRVQEIHNQCLTRRDEADLNIFADAHLKSISELEAKLKQLETLLQNFEDKKDLQSFVLSKSKEISTLQAEIETTRKKQEEHLAEVSKNRADYAKTLGLIEVAIDRMLSDVENLDTKWYN